MAVTLQLDRSGVLQEKPPARDAGFQEGESIAGRYRVESVLGEGGMGRVYRVADALHPERRVALKTLAGPIWRVELLKAEFHTMSSLMHPHIARVYDFETLPGGVAFTMEYLEGRDLFAASEGAPEQVVEWTVQACRALSYLHSRGVIHADFKPHNVLVTGGGVKVLDFGLSGGVGAGLVLGTPAYMAPELARGVPPDARVDLYALGITLYQLVHRRLPFVARGVDELLALHAGAPLPFPTAHPLNEVIARLCAKSPDDRFTGANEVIAALSTATARVFAPETRETRKSYLASARMIGRAAEEEALLAYCLARVEGRSADDAVVATVTGPSGVGKSRLGRELRKKLQLAGVPFLEADCYEVGELEPLESWLEALRRSSGREPPAMSFEGDDETRRMRRLGALADYVLDLSLGVVLWVNDLQWARTSTIDFLLLLCQRLAARRDAGREATLALVASFRDDEVAGRPLESFLAQVSRRLSLALRPLPAAGTAELISAMLGAGDIPALFSERLARETGGNPFFIEELLRVLMERGDVHLDAGHWAARTDVAHLELPRSIAAVLERRLSSLPPEQRQLLTWLAVYAQPMPLPLLARLAPVDEVRQLVAAGLCAVADDRARPAHDKLREYLYAQLAPEAGRRHHHAIAQVLGDDHLFARAHHAWHAGDADAADWCARAARLAEESFATDVAIDNYERLRRLTGDRRATDRLLELCTVTGQYQRIVDVTGAEDREDPMDRARLLQLSGEALGSSGRVAEGLERLRQSVALLGGAVPRRPLARQLFIARHYLTHLVRLRFSRPLVAARALSDRERRRREILGWCYFLMSVYSMLLGDDLGTGVSFAGLNTVLALGRHPMTRRILVNVSLTHHLLGHYDVSRRLFAEARAFTSSDGERLEFWPTEMLARVMTQVPVTPDEGPVTAYEADLVRAIEHMSTRSKAIFANLARVVATIAISQYAERHRFRPELFRWADSMHGSVHYSFVQGTAAVMALVDGQKARALEALDKAQRGNTTPVYRAWINASFAYVCALTGDTARAADCLRAARAVLGTIQTRAANSYWTPVWTLSACVALMARGGDAPWVRECLGECVDRLARGRPLPLATFFLEAGRVALGRGKLSHLEAAKARSHADWLREPTVAGHPDGCVVAALALKLAGRPSLAWSDEAIGFLDGRFPAAYVAQVRALVHCDAAV